MGAWFGFEALKMGTLLKRKDIPPWVRVPEDLKDPEVFLVQTRLAERRAERGESFSY